MSIHSRAALIALVAVAATGTSVAAQQRGTMEFGGFASAASFDKALTLDSGIGAGGRIGMFAFPWLSFEFEQSFMKATRPLGLNDVNVGILGGRVVGVAYDAKPFSIIGGIGAGISTETNFLHAYGVDVLAGVKYLVKPQVAVRLDGVFDWLSDQNEWKSYQTLRLGVSFYRHP
jgi:hypothetical protein